MTTPAAVALGRLLPTLHPLPPRLFDTADSLLALSRQRAPNLKGDEEIARAHACAEIACQRLREKLRLPPIKAGTAPASKKTYAKLVGFLEGVLGGEVGTGKGSTTPGKRKNAGGNEEGTPSKKAKLTPSTANTPTTPATKTWTPTSFLGKIKSMPQISTDSDAEAPPFVLPTIRTLSSTFSTPSMTPHVYTGVCTVLKFANLYPRPSLDEATEQDLEVTDEMYEADVTALVVGLWLMVLTCMMRGKMTGALFKGVVRKAGEVLERLEDEGKEVEGWVKRINRKGYARRGQGWWGSVPEGVFDFGIERVHTAVVGHEEMEVGEDVREGVDGEEAGRQRREELNLEPDPEDVLLPGLGTMMQDAVDWTSEDRRREFKEWKSEILTRLESLPDANGAIAVH